MPSLVSQGFNWDDYAIEVDTDDPFFRQLNLTIQVNADFDNLPIFSVDVSIDYPPWTAKHGVQTFSFRKADDIGKFNAFIEGGSTKFKYRYVVNYKGESRVFESREIGARGQRPQDQRRRARPLAGGRRGRRHELRAGRPRGAHAGAP